MIFVFFKLMLCEVFALVCCCLNFEHRTIYNMCTQKPPHDYSQQLYDKYREAFEEYITKTVRDIVGIGVVNCDCCETD